MSNDRPARREKKFGLTRHAREATPEELNLIADLLPQVHSFGELASVMGVPLEVARVNAQPLLALMRAAGTLPPCMCGGARFHGGRCGMGRRRQVSPERQHRRALAIEMLVAGDRLSEIEQALGMGRCIAKVYLRDLAPSQRAERDRAVAQRSQALSTSNPFRRSSSEKRVS